MAKPGIRFRLALLISLLVIGIVAGTFFAVRQTTRSELESRLDNDLELQFREFSEFPAVAQASTPEELERASHDFLASQSYHPASTIFAIELAGSAPISNEHDVVESESGAESTEQEGSGGSVLDAPPGFADVSAHDAGNLRVYSHTVALDGKPTGTFRVAEPLAPVEDAESGLAKSYLVVGAAALAIAIAAAIWIASRLTRPLRRMARTASGIEAGALSDRIGDVGTDDEMQTLADAFDSMLDRLEQAFDRQRDFVSDASHELRTPLTVLRGNVDALRRSGVETADRDRVVAILSREIEHMNRLVDDMLTLARAEAGTLVEEETIELAGLFEDLRRDLPLFGDRDYRVDPPPAGSIQADPTRLSQVLRNLIRNAVEHTEVGDEVSIEVRARDSRIVFSVADTGPGISAAELDRVFDRFHRVDGGRARSAGGAGLGLAIARAIVEAHGGRIWAEANAGRGTTFRFELPGYRADSA